VSELERVRHAQISRNSAKLQELLEGTTAAAASPAVPPATPPRPAACKGASPPSVRHQLLGPAGDSPDDGQSKVPADDGTEAASDGGVQKVEREKRPAADVVDIADPSKNPSKKKVKQQTKKKTKID
jgi:hypothetical protein